MPSLSLAELTPLLLPSLVLSTSRLRRVFIFQLPSYTSSFTFPPLHTLFLTVSTCRFKSHSTLVTDRLDKRAL
ncbi:hypothetical protein EDB84DRAFT_977157 [Lactarius hengduanensis]|nr:hypothetical protein EDB84DRAFT_977157 [Lactarius hengduanensis]